MSSAALYFGVGYIAVVAAFIYILIMGPSKFHRDGRVGQMHRYITDGFWSDLHNVILRICGDACVRKTSECSEHLFTSAHPLLQVFYLLLVSTALLGFLVESQWRWLDDDFPAWHRFMVPFAVVWAYRSFWLASTSDPGRITEGNHDRALHLYPFDNVIFTPKPCRTCKFTRPARSKHCSLCKVCVSKADHHCAWINNCVGLLNYRYFLNFLLATAVLCTYGVCIIYRLFWQQIDRQQLLQMTYTNDFGQRVSVTTWIAFQTPLLGGIGLFAAMAAAIVWCFLGFHLYLIAQGMTTNEQLKRGDYHVQMEIEREHREHEEQQSASSSSNAAADNKADDRSAKKRRKTTKPEQSSGDKKTDGTNVEYARNLYHRGFWLNLKEVLFPPSL